MYAVSDQTVTLNQLILDKKKNHINVLTFVLTCNEIRF